MKAINLIPVAERRQSVRLTNLSPVTLTVIGVLCAAVVAVAAIVIVDSRISDRHEEVAAVQAQTAQAQAQAQQVTGDLAVLQSFQRSAEAARGLDQIRYNWPGLFARVSASLPARVKLTNIDGSLGGADAAAAATAGAGASLKLNGCANSLRSVASTMQRIRRLTGVKSVTLGTSSQGSADNATCPYPRSFDLSVALTGPAVATTGATTP